MQVQSSNPPPSTTEESLPGFQQRVTRWGKGAVAGLLAGTLLVTVEMFLTGLSGRGTLWDPLRLSASIAMGDRAVATSEPFAFNIFFLGMLVHFVLSVW